MSQLSSEKFNVAWFKLAEFVARKEKERAISIYRLLVHSIPGDALKLQLEGDLLLSFNDLRALSCYAKAAELYERDGKYIEAIAVHEHCFALSPTNLEYAHALIRLYGAISNESKILQYSQVIIRSLVASGQTDAALMLIESSPIPERKKSTLCEYYIICLLEHTPFNENQISHLTSTILKQYSERDNSTMLASFMSKLQAVSSDAYNFACKKLSELGAKNS
jgi:tetratricopeptide (TPR) repeat protein